MRGPSRKRQFGDRDRHTQRETVQRRGKEGPVKREAGAGRIQPEAKEHLLEAGSFP